jgi:transcriptional regulator with XRE-family HTH domain
MDIVSVIKRYGKTSKEVADALNTSPGYISQLGSGKTAPSIKKLDELAAVIGCHRWEFFIDEMDREAVATAFGLAEPSAQPAPADTSQPAAEPAPKTEASQADNLPFTNNEPEQEAEKREAVAAIICPHCGEAIKLAVI